MVNYVNVSHINTRLKIIVIDGYRVPLPFRNLRNLDEKPLSCRVFEARLDDAEFHGTTWVYDDLAQLGGTPCTIFAIHSFTEVEYTNPDRESPTLVTQTMLRRVEGEG